MGYFKYDKFFELLKKKKIKITDMLDAKILTCDAYRNMKKNNANITTKTICKICDYLNCKPNQIMEFVKGDANDPD